MKRYIIISVLVLLVMVTFSCQTKVEVKPDTKTNAIPKTNLVVTPVKTNDVVVVPVKTNILVVTNVVEKTNAVVVPDKFDNTDYKNVIKVLRDSIDSEKQEPSPRTILDSTKAHALVGKFMRENISEVRYGFTEDDITLMKSMAIIKMKKVIKDSRASESEKAEAQKEISETESI